MHSQKPSDTMMKLTLMRTAPGKEDQELPLLQRISYITVTGFRNGHVTALQIRAHVIASVKVAHTR